MASIHEAAGRSWPGEEASRLLGEIRRAIGERAFSADWNAARHRPPEDVAAAALEAP